MAPRARPIGRARTAGMPPDIICRHSRTLFSTVYALGAGFASSTPCLDRRNPGLDPFVDELAFVFGEARELAFKLACADFPHSELVMDISPVAGQRLIKARRHRCAHIGDVGRDFSARYPFLGRNCHRRREQFFRKFQRSSSSWSRWPYSQAPATSLFDMLGSDRGALGLPPG